MPYHQTTLTLPAHARGIHIITPMLEQAIDSLMLFVLAWCICFYSTPQPALLSMKMRILMLD